MALRIEDIELDRGVIHVRRGWDILEGEITPKSGRERNVPIAAALHDHLAAHLLALPWKEGLVFGVSATRPFNGTPLFKRAERAWDAAGFADHPARVPSHLRFADDRSGCQRQGAVDVHGPREHLDHARPLRPSDARQRDRGRRNARRLSAPVRASIAPKPVPAPGYTGRNGTNGGGPNGASNALLAQNLAARRRALGLTQDELARRAQMSPTLISRVESGQRAPTVTTLRQIAQALEANLASTSTADRTRTMTPSPAP